MSPFDQESAKKAVAKAALAYLPKSGVIGLGTGSTAKYFIEGVAHLVREGRDLRAVPTSERSRRQAESLAIPMASIDGPWTIDLTVDGADEVSQSLDLIKGGGGAHTREKIVNNASRMNIIVVDESKLSAHLGEKWSIPIEVLAFAHKTTKLTLEAFGVTKLRSLDGKVLRTDSGNFIYDLNYGIVKDPRFLDAEIRGVPGVVETGIFCGRADLVLVAGATGVRELRPTP